MKSVYTLAALLLALPAHATTYTFDLLFEGDSVFTLQKGFETCSSGNACYPEDFRLANGFFASLTPGERTTATLDLTAGTAKIAEWDVAGSPMANALGLADFNSISPTGSTVFSNESVTVTSEGPEGYDAGFFCDPNTPAPDLPSGYCGFYGYTASFEVLNLSKVPLPAPALMFISALGLLSVVRRKRSTRA